MGHPRAVVGSRWAAAALTGVVAAVVVLAGAGCSEPCCTTDGFPVTLLAPSGDAAAQGLRAKARGAAGDPSGDFTLAIDTGTPLTSFRRSGDQGTQITDHNFDLLDAVPNSIGDYPVRAEFRGIGTLPLALDAAGPDAVLGAGILLGYSVQFRFSTPSLTFWPRQGADSGFLASAGFAVVDFQLTGGGEISALTKADFLGLTGPVEVPATRVVLRTCGAPAAFDPASVATPQCCPRGAELELATGVDLALLVSTGTGPLVLSQSAWKRVAAQMTAQGETPTEPTEGAALRLPAGQAPIDGVLWSVVPRLAMVDEEADASLNPGACVELGRARRLEWIEAHSQADIGPCVQPCDADARDSTQAQNSAAYVEVDGGIPVAIVPDGAPFLQALRAEIRPEGPEIDGLLGAAVFAHMEMELDYQSTSKRAILACDNDLSADGVCKTAPRCPRLASATDSRSCFGLAKRSLPATCDPTCGQ